MRSRKEATQVVQPPKRAEALFIGTIKIQALPNLSGVSGLSVMEIKDDLREMQQPHEDDTDSDSSIKSEDILDSIYPVQPRKTPKASGADLGSFSYHGGGLGLGLGGGPSVEDALYFLKD
ncbi:hypothetical protein B484DRAFT_436013, partial [Ochromonadaceae sp. CCMP2298]